MKRTVVALLCLLLLIPYGSVAASTPSEEELDSQLLILGYPQEVILSIEPGLKEILVAEQAVHVYSEQKSDYLGERGAVSPLGLLSNYSDWFIVSEVSGISGMRTYRLSYSWAWLFAPTVTLTDKVGISWESGWDYVNSSRQSAYTCHSGDYSQTDTSNTFETDSVTGLGYSFDILSGFNYGGQYQSADSHSGYITVSVQHTESGMSGADSLSMMGKYYHKDDVLGLSGSFTFGDVSISISYSGNYSNSAGYLYTYNFNWD